MTKLEAVECKEVLKIKEHACQSPNVNLRTNMFCNKESHVVRQIALMYLICFSQRIGIVFQSSQILVFITEKEGVYCAVQIESTNIVQNTFRL
jgi:hypothetical protein